MCFARSVTTPGWASSRPTATATITHDGVHSRNREAFRRYGGADTLSPSPPSPAWNCMHRPLVTLIALCVPLTIGAQQQPLSSESQAPNGVAQTFLSYGRPYGGWLLMAFDSIPASQYGFRPTPVQQSIGYIAQHLEDANYQLCSMFGEQQHVMATKDSLADTIKAQWPKDTLIGRLRASLVFCRAAIEKLTDAKLAERTIAGIMMIFIEHRDRPRIRNALRRGPHRRGLSLAPT